ncbi:helix-turn-helix transcriptional regulator [Pseudonocardia sp. GCM10023141]|uniref:helix-turn-helix transcriptional regulator n=1 Tax=Pseudonocardia sp. GCM10023141 TaxID=3252653 RepID=UPI00361F97AB
MSDRRQQVLEAIQRAVRPVGVSEIAAQLSVHPNTARFHLESLVADGVAERTMDAASGPGRPRLLYRQRPGLARGGTRRYQILAEIMLSHLAAAGPTAGEAATTAGRAWGAHLISRPAPFHEVTRADAITRLVAMLEDLDFAPDVATDDPDLPTRVRLRHCPFLELAQEHRDLVCPLHLGLMQGALAELHAPLAATGLEPFAEAGACLAHLTPIG